MKTMDTKVALAGYGSIDVRGREMLGGDEHEHHYWSMFSIGLGHRELTERECKMLDVFGNVSSIGDPRLWPFRATRLVAVFGDIYLATATATLFNSRGGLAQPATGRAMRQMKAMREELGDDSTLEEVKAFLTEMLERKEIISGYNVVARPTDERHDFMKPYLMENGFYEEPYLKQTLKIDQAMWELREIRPNNVSHLAAIYLDLGFEPSQGEAMMLAGWSWAVAANAVEVIDDGDYSGLKRLPDEFVTWKGKEDRISPRAPTTV